MNKKNIKNLILIIAPVVYLVASIIVILALLRSGTYPSGEETYYHLYRGNYIYNSVKAGNWYPLLDLNWYNGAELLRFWSPLPAYVMAFCQLLAGGSIFYGYLLYVALILFAGGLSWLYIGLREGRPVLCSILGLYWFFTPVNLYTLFTEGNLARSLLMIFLPVFVYEIYSFLKRQSWKKLLVISVMMIMITLCHIGYALMVFAATIIFLIIYIVAIGKLLPSVEIILSMLLALAILGIWMVPFIFSDVSGVDSSEAMANFFQSIWITLNPLERLSDDNKEYYYGLSVFILDIFGIIYAKKEEKPGFITALVLVIFSCNTMYYILRLMPGGQYFWMLRFLAILVALSLVSMVFWKSLRRCLVIIICILLFVDTIPSLALIKGDDTGVAPETTLEEMGEYSLITEGKEITNQRLALMDLSTLSADGAYLVSAYDNGVKGTFGAGWEAAATSGNIVQLNKALSEGYYPYLFDRLLELGNDTVIIRISQAETWNYTIEDIEAAAEKVGYTLIDEAYDYLLFHYDTAPESGFGVVSEFKAIGIGSGAPTISLQFPAVEETDTTKLDDFTYEELSKYDLIYLDGFTYDDRDYAENLILKLSENGVKIVILADGIPEDRKTHDQSFLGVTCNTISFSNGYPELDTIIGTLNTDLFPQGYEDWQTVYMEGLTDVWGTIYDNDLELAFYGTGSNENLIYIGINLTCFYGLTRDESVGELLANAMELDGNELPKRTLVPVEMTSDGKTITITTDYDSVNTTLANHDIYSTASTIEAKNNLLYVNAGTTVIKLKYPYLIPGIIVSLVGIVAMLMFLRMIYKEYDRKKYNT
jgi:uncharacterized membrane protein